MTCDFFVWVFSLSFGSSFDQFNSVACCYLYPRDPLGIDPGKPQANY